MLSGIHHGINLRKLPPPPIEGNAYLQKNMQLPKTWEEARKIFESAEILPKFLGKEFCLLFSNLKLGEQSRFLSNIKPPLDKTI